MLLKNINTKVKEIKIKGKSSIIYIFIFQILTIYYLIDPLNAMRYKHIPTFTTMGADVTLKEMNEII